MEENNTQNKIKNIQKEDNLNLKQNKQIDKRKPTTPEHYSYFKLKNEKTDNRYLITVTNFQKKKKRNEISVDNIFQKKTEKKSSNIQIIDLTDGKDKVKKDTNLKDKKDKEMKDKKEKEIKEKKDNNFKEKKEKETKEKKDYNFKEKKEKELKEKKEKEIKEKKEKELKEKKEKELKEKKEKEQKEKKEKLITTTTTTVFSNRIPRKISFDNTTTSKSREKKRTNIKIEGNKLDTKISSEKKHSEKKIDKKNNKREEKKEYIKNNIKNREVSIELDTNKKSLNFSSDEKLKKDIKKISNKNENINLIKPSKETIELNLETPRDDSSDKKGISKENNIETIKDNQLDTPIQSNNIKIIKENSDDNNLKKENPEDNNP